jgi:hypothetical protein
MSNGNTSKIDYLFFKQAYFNVNTGSGASNPSQAIVDTSTTYSDHFPLIATKIAECNTNTCTTL